MEFKGSIFDVRVYILLFFFFSNWAELFWQYEKMMLTYCITSRVTMFDFSLISLDDIRLFFFFLLGNSSRWTTDFFPVRLFCSTVRRLVCVCRGYIYIYRASLTRRNVSTRWFKYNLAPLEGGSRTCCVSVCKYRPEGGSEQEWHATATKLGENGT